MAVIYLQHPKHGAKVAISQQEADNDMQNGWEEFDPTEAVNESPAPVAEAAPAKVFADGKDEVTDVVNELPRRRGRRPVETE